MTNRQLIFSISFGHESMSIATVGKNGGIHFPAHIGHITDYGDRIEAYDTRDAEEKTFTDRQEMYTYYETKYKDEIVHE